MIVIDAGTLRLTHKNDASHPDEDTNTLRQTKEGGKKIVFFFFFFFFVCNISKG